MSEVKSECRRDHRQDFVGTTAFIEQRKTLLVRLVFGPLLVTAIDLPKPNIGDTANNTSTNCSLRD